MVRRGDTRATVTSDSDRATNLNDKERLDILLDQLISRNLSPDDVLSLLRHRILQNGFSIPAILFSNRSLSVFELIVRYLHEKHRLSLKEIAALLNRDLDAVESKYYNSRIIPLEYPDSGIAIPAYLFRDRSLSFLEHITEYLKDAKRMRHSEIAHLLNRDPKTIWTIYMRAKEKRLKDVKLELPEL
jgi:hypothetical protein